MNNVASYSWDHLGGLLVLKARNWITTHGHKEKTHHAIGHELHKEIWIDLEEIWNDLEEIWNEFNENIIFKVVIKHFNQWFYYLIKLLNEFKRIWKWHDFGESLKT